MSKVAIQTDAAPQAIGPYSQAIKHAAGEMVFLSGQVAIDPKTQEFADGDARAQARLVLENLKAVVEASGAGMSDVVKTTVYLRSFEDFAVVNQVYGEYFAEPYPARATVEVAGLPKGALVEIDAIIVKG